MKKQSHAAEQVKSYRVLGIDPGESGAFAVYDLGTREYAVLDYPKDPALLAAELRKLEGITLAVLENITTIYMPPSAGRRVQPKGMITFGKNCGLWEGLLLGLKIPYTKIAPAKWQNAILDSSRKGATTKERSVAFVNRRFSADFKKSHHNRTDAICLALYGEKLLRGA